METWMHEMSVAQSLITLAEAEAQAKGCNRLLRLVVEYGTLSGIMPDALSFCVDALVKGTLHEGLQLELVKLPLVMRCPFCGARFGGDSADAVLEPCPQCGETFGHQVESGRELILARLEAERSPACVANYVK